MTNAEKLRCIERELRQRYRTYPRMVAAGKMTARTMNREFAVLEEIAADLRAAVEREEERTARPGLAQIMTAG